MEDMLKEKIMESLAGSDKTLVKTATDAALCQISEERRIKLGEHAVAVRIAAEEEKLEAALAEHDKAVEAAIQVVEERKAVQDKAETAYVDQLKKKLADAAKKRLGNAFKELARDAGGTLDNDGTATHEFTVYLQAKDDGELFAEWQMRTSYHPIASGKCPVPAEILELRTAKSEAEARVEQLKKNVLELRRRMQRLSGYERRMRGRLSALALAQSEEGQEILHALEAISTEPLPRLSA